MRSNLCAALALVIATRVAAREISSSAHRPSPGISVAQAERVLELLREVAAGQPRPALVDAVLAERGTDLVIAQMNVGRTVTKEQYAEVLRAFAEGREPRLDRFGGDERARRGVNALREVLRILRWGATHADVLAVRLTALARSDLASDAHRRADAALPDPPAPGGRLQVVMGGRAGGAATGNDVYFDLLAYAAFESTGEVPMFGTSAVVETFAHELHHIGLTATLERAGSALKLAPASARAYGLVKLLVLEGSATWLVDAERDPARLRRDAAIARELDRGDALLGDVERLLQRTLAGELDGDAYEAARAPLLAAGFHAAGALLLEAIDREGGKDAVMAVLRDPRKLLVTYNGAVRELAKGHALDAKLAGALARIGEDRRKQAPQ